MPVRFTRLEVGPDRRRTLAAAAALRAAGLRVEAVTDTAVLVRAEDAARAEDVVAALPGAS